MNLDRLQAPNIIIGYQSNHDKAQSVLREGGVDIDITETIRELESEMLTAANNLEFEKAALCRDQIKELKRATDGNQPAKETKPISYRKSKHAGK